MLHVYRPSSKVVLRRGESGVLKTKSGKALFANLFTELHGGGEIILVGRSKQTSTIPINW